MTLLAALADDALSARWGEFAARYVPSMHSYCQAKFPDLDADDLVQETLIALVTAMPHYRYDPEAKGLFRNWLFGILRHKAFAQYKARKRKNETERRFGVEAADYGAMAMAEDPGRDPEREREELQSAAMELALRELLADPSVHDQSKQIFIKVAIEGKAPAEVAAAFGVSRDVVDHVRSRLTARLKRIVSKLDIGLIDVGEP